MSRSEKKAYLEAIRRRYRRSNRVNKAKILDEFCAVCHYNRKYAIRLLHQRKRLSRQKPGRPSRYTTPALLAPLKAIWFATDQMCSKRLKAVIPDWLPYYEQAHGILDELIRGQLLSLSAATIDRLLKPTRLQYPGKGRSGTKPGRLLKTQIPIKTDHWDVTQPGFVEADTVAHCGNSLAGDFIWSLTLTDIYSTWTENRATWNKGAAGVNAQIADIEKSLPFELLGFDRLDNPLLVPLINDLYANEWSLYQNHFCPTMKLKEKKKVLSRYTRKYYPPQTPYQRLLESNALSSQQKGLLKQHHQDLNPFALKRTIEQKLKRIFQSVSVTSFVRQRVQ